MDTFRVAGVMSGTSLDGVDMALCSFNRNGGKWTFKVEAAETEPYNDEWKKNLSNIHTKGAEELALTHAAYGKFLGELVKKFLDKNKFSADFISSHGHTIFHQ